MDQAAGPFLDDDMFMAKLVSDPGSEKHHLEVNGVELIFDATCTPHRMMVEVLQMLVDAHKLWSLVHRSEKHVEVYEVIQNVSQAVFD